MYPWAENNIKFAAAKKALKDGGNAKPEEVDVAKEYVKMGGRIVHPKSGKIIDNNIGATRDTTGQIEDRDTEAVNKAIEKVIEAFSSAPKANK